jgi:hypothetical protein
MDSQDLHTWVFGGGVRQVTDLMSTSGYLSSNLSIAFEVTNNLGTEKVLGASHTFTNIGAETPGELGLLMAEIGTRGLGKEAG